MAYILQVGFKMRGPFEMKAHEFSGLAESINNEEGFLWKIWTENQDTSEAGGIYCFRTKRYAETYLEIHSKRLTNLGVADFNAKIFSINAPLTKITKGLY